MKQGSVLSFIRHESPVDKLLFRQIYGSAANGNRAIRAMSCVYTGEFKSRISPALWKHIGLRKLAAMILATHDYYMYAIRNVLDSETRVTSVEQLCHMRVCSPAGVQLSPESPRLRCDQYLVCPHCYYRRLKGICTGMSRRLSEGACLAAISIRAFSHNPDGLPTKQEVHTINHMMQGVAASSKQWICAYGLPQLRYDIIKQNDRAGDAAEETGRLTKRWCVSYFVLALVKEGTYLPDPDKDLDLTELNDVWTSYPADETGLLTAIGDHCQYPARLLYSDASAEHFDRFIQLAGGRRLRQRSYGFKEKLHEKASDRYSDSRRPAFEVADLE